MGGWKDAMADLSPDNRLSFEQYASMAAAMQERYGVSDMKAMTIVDKTLTQRQKILDERVKASGGKAWGEMRKHPQAEALWAQWTTPPAPAE